MQTESGNSKPRRLSLTSSAMVFGSFPEDSLVPDPIINCLILMEDLPDREEMITLVKRALEFERMSGSK